MQNFDLKQNIRGAFAPGREHLFAPWNIFSNASSTAKKVQNIESGQGGRSLLPEGGADAPQSGRSMIEMLGVLAIIGVLSVGGIAGYSKAMQKYRINKTIEQITLIAGNIRTFFAPQKNYVGVSCHGSDCDTTNGCDGHSGVKNGNPTTAYNGCPIIKKAKIFPDEMITVTDGKIMSITNPFGGAVDLYTVEKSAYGDNQAFRITYYIGDNEEACIELLTHDWIAANVGFIGVWNLEDVDDSDFILPATVDNSVEVCSHAGGSTAMLFYFGVDMNYWKDFYSGDTWY